MALQEGGLADSSSIEIGRRRAMLDRTTTPKEEEWIAGGGVWWQGCINLFFLLSLVEHEGSGRVVIITRF